VLPVELTTAGAIVEELVVYRNEDVRAFPENVQRQLDAGEINWIGLSSPSIARQFAKLISDQARSHLGQRIHLAAISPVTAQAATEAGLRVAGVAEDYTWNGILAAIEKAATR